MKVLTETSKFDFFSDTSRPDLGPSVIKIFSKKTMFPRTSGNDLISMLALSDRQIDASGTHFGPFSFVCIFYLIGIIGCSFVSCCFVTMPWGMHRTNFNENI